MKYPPHCSGDQGIKVLLYVNQ